MSQKIKSPLRYPGGKSKALNKILPHLTSIDFDEYREPFVGGGSVFIALKQLRPNAKYWINDLNSDLICFWNQIKKNVDEFVAEVTRIKNTHQDGKLLFNEMMSLPYLNQEFCKDEFYKAVRFYVLNRITYSGTVDSGGYSSEAFKKRFTISNISKLKNLSLLLKDVKITNDSYESVLAKEGKNVLLFMDPPYWKTRKEGLYGKKGALHKSFDHEKFSERVRECKHKWLITYDDSELIHNLFGFARIESWEMHYGMTNVNGKKTVKGKELFLTNIV